jgi:hypothetical protein
MSFTYRISIAFYRGDPQRMRREPLSYHSLKRSNYKYHFAALCVKPLRHCGDF